MNNRTPIGGYFGWDFSRRGDFPNDHCVLVNSSRNALEYILQVILRKHQIVKVYLPYFTCEVVLEPLQRIGIPFQFYDIDDNLEICGIDQLSDGEYIIANNYFGIKDCYIESLRHRFKGNLIIDNSQAFFAPAQLADYAFYSPRKFVAAADGGIAAVTDRLGPLERDQSYDRCVHLLMREDVGAEKGYRQFLIDDEMLIGLPLKGMSKLTESMLRSYDYNFIKEARRRNYDILRESLQSTNSLKTPVSADVACPMVYPYRTNNRNLRQELIDNKIFVARYWPNVLEWCNASPVLTSYKLTEEIIPLPIDQRYAPEDMRRIINIINNAL